MRLTRDDILARLVLEILLDNENTHFGECETAVCLWSSQKDEGTGEALEGFTYQRLGWIAKVWSKYKGGIIDNEGF